MLMTGAAIAGGKFYALHVENYFRAEMEALKESAQKAPLEMPRLESTDQAPKSPAEEWKRKYEAEKEQTKLLKVEAESLSTAVTKLRHELDIRRKSPAGANEAQVAFQLLLRDVELVRELKFASDPKLVLTTRPEVEKRIKTALLKEYPETTHEARKRAALALGQATAPFDYLSSLVVLSLEQGAIFYDDETHEILVEEGLDTDNDVIFKGKLIIEIARALMMQNFDTSTLRAVLDNADQTLARRAVLYGDASASRIHLSLVEALNDPSATVPGAPRQLALGAVPLYLRQWYMFPYEMCERFSLQVLQQNGPKALADLIKNPPLSTAQVLMPEEYFEKKAAAPVNFIFDPAPLGDQSMIATDTLGSFSLITLLRTTLRDAEAVEAVQGWRGDRYSVWGEKEGSPEADTLGWVSAWASEAEAKAFARGIWLTMTQRYSIPNDPSYAQPDGGYRIDQAGRSLLVSVIRVAPDGLARVLVANSQKMATTQEIEKRLLTIK
jgi:hypothetical protein